MAQINREDEWTELDENFKLLIQDMLSEDDFGYSEREKVVNYDFLYEDDLDDTDEESLSKKRQSVLNNILGTKKRKKKVLTSVSRIALIVVCVLMTGSGIAIWINSEPANALKFHIEKKFYAMKNGDFTTEESLEGEVDEGSISKVYKKDEDISKAKQFAEDLPIPQYIPEGFKLEKLYVEKLMDGQSTTQYTYKKDKKRVYINSFFSNDNSHNQNTNNTDIIEMDDRKILMWEEPDTETIGCTLMLRNINLYIFGDINTEELRKIAVSIVI